MDFSKPIFDTSKKHIGILAPIPIYNRVFTDHEFHDDLYSLGFNTLSESQKLMGQELPYQYDYERQKNYEGFISDDMWVEYTQRPPIGSRFFVEPNNFLDIDNMLVEKLKKRIIKEFNFFIKNTFNIENNNSKITESWIQYYNPLEGRGHNKHNHSRWNPDEESLFGYSGGYYLSDGDPIKDHPYSGVFTFHIRESNYFIRPKKGLLLIWPNDIVHSVNPFYGKTHRCVINFNIFSYNSN